MALFFAETAYAHSLYDRPPPGIFALKWDFDPTLLFFLFMIFMYIRGLGKFKNRSPVAWWQKLLFALGMLALMAALVPPIDPLSDQLFFFHMIQHMLITSVGAPLMLFGVPFFVCLRGAPNWFRRYVFIPMIKTRWLMAIHRFMLRPLPALAFFEFNFWFWHHPLFYNMALLNDAYHLLEHGLMAISSIYLWRNIIDPHPMRAFLPLPARMIFIASVEAANVGLSAALTFSKHPWYAYEMIPQPAWWTWGYLQDQQLGGLIMWVPGGFIHIFTLTVIFFVWAHRTQAQEKAELATQDARGALALPDSQGAAVPQS